MKKNYNNMLACVDLNKLFLEVLYYNPISFTLWTLFSPQKAVELYSSGQRSCFEKKVNRVVKGVLPFYPWFMKKHFVEKCFWLMKNPCKQLIRLLKEPNETGKKIAILKLLSDFSAGEIVATVKEPQSIVNLAKEIDLANRALSSKKRMLTDVFKEKNFYFDEQSLESFVNDTSIGLKYKRILMNSYLETQFDVKRLYCDKEFLDQLAFLAQSNLYFDIETNLNTYLYLEQNDFDLNKLKTDDFIYVLDKLDIYKKLLILKRVSITNDNFDRIVEYLDCVIVAEDTCFTSLTIPEFLSVYTNIFNVVSTFSKVDTSFFNESLDRFFERFENYLSQNNTDKEIKMIYQIVNSSLCIAFERFLENKSFLCQIKESFIASQSFVHEKRFLNKILTRVKYFKRNSYEIFTEE